MFQADYFLSMIKQGKNPEQMMLQFLENTNARNSYGRQSNFFSTPRKYCGN
jgi:glutamine amidotransferase PdxT